MFALAGPKRLVTLVPAWDRAIPLFSVESQTMVSFYCFPHSASCQNASRKVTIRVSLVQGLLMDMYPVLRTLLEVILAGRPSLGLNSGSLQSVNRLRGSDLVGIQLQLTLVGGERLGGARGPFESRS